jgi:RNA polymerase sigma-70 factor (ECF subfamily)
VTRDESFAGVVREHEALVFRTLARLVGSGDHIQDLAQEVFFRLYRAMRCFRGTSKLSTYIYRITVNVAQDEWKRRKRESGYKLSLSDPDANWEERLSSPSPGADRVLEREQLLNRVERALAELNDSERLVLVLYHQEECTYQQIADTLQIPIGTVRTHLHRGRENLRDRVREKLCQLKRSTDEL